MRAQKRIAANRLFRDGMERVLPLTAAADPKAAKSCSGRPSRPVTSASSPSPATAAWPGRQLGRAAPDRAPGGRVPFRRDRVHGALRRQQPPAYLRYRGIEVAESFVGLADRPEFGDARHVAAPVAGPSSPVRSISSRWRPPVSFPPAPSAWNACSSCRCPSPRRPGWPTRRTDAGGLHRVRAGAAKLLVELAPRRSRRTLRRPAGGRGGILHRQQARLRPPPRTWMSCPAP